MGAHETKTFKCGNSEAVRLPKGMGFGIGTDVRVEREAGRIVVTPVADPAADKAALLAMLAALRALPKPPSIEKRDRFEFPERPGL